LATPQYTAAKNRQVRANRQAVSSQRFKSVFFCYGTEWV